MELRDIEIFLTLAEELHFGRTAQRLHLSQARVSQSVKSQERRIGARLVDRSNPATSSSPCSAGSSWPSCSRRIGTWSRPSITRG